MNSEIKNCQNCRIDFIIEPEDFLFYEKIKVPPPTWCPECRFQRRVVWRNEIFFYKRKCDATGKEIFAMFAPDASVRVYDRDYWWSDKWDPMEYAKEYDFSRPFFEQLKELIQTVPWPSRSIHDCIKSDYCMNCSDLKDCYMLFDADHSEESAYGVGVNYIKNSFDNLSLDQCELCYESFACINCYGALFSSNCEDSNNILFCKDCVNCTDCFGCVGLRNKSYCISNEQYTKKEYFKKLADFDLGSYQNFLELQINIYRNFQKFPMRFMQGSHNQDVSGEYIYNSKNVLDSYMVAGGEDSRFCFFTKLQPGPKNCYDYDLFGWNAEKIYECDNVGYGSSDIKFSVLTYGDVHDIEYSMHCVSGTNNLFGCVGLRNKSYCILNKQYTKEEYEKFVPRIIEHINTMPYVDKVGRMYGYGEFIPSEFCPYAYNESIAQEYMPLKKERVEERGFKWRDPAVRGYLTTLSWKDLPDHIKEVSDSILNETILCCVWDENPAGAVEHNCTKAFRIIEPELKFYRKMNLPLPRKCFYCRHHERTRQRRPIFKKYHRQCVCNRQDIYKNQAEHFHGSSVCTNEFETSYASDRSAIIYCAECYQAEVV